MGLPKFEDTVPVKLPKFADTRPVEHLPKFEDTNPVVKLPKLSDTKPVTPRYKGLKLARKVIQEVPSPMQYLDPVSTGKKLWAALEVAGAPFELAGEAVKAASGRSKDEFKSPSIVQRMTGTDEGKPVDIFTEIVGGYQAMLAGALAPLTGESITEAAVDELNRPKDRISDNIAALGMAVLVTPGGAKSLIKKSTGFFQDRARILELAKAFKPRKTVVAVMNRMKKSSNYKTAKSYLERANKEGVKLVEAPQHLADTSVELQGGRVAYFKSTAVEDMANTVPKDIGPRLKKIEQGMEDGTITDITDNLGDRLKGTVARVEETGKYGVHNVMDDQFMDGATRYVTASEETMKTRAAFDVEFGFKAGSKESAAMQHYGETLGDVILGGVTPKVLIKKFGSKVGNKIAKAIRWTRKQVYDPMWIKVNQQRAANGLEAVPYRKDYFTHFDELNVAEELGILGTGSVKDLDEAAKLVMTRKDLINGTHSKLKNIIWRFTKRKMGEFKDDAVGGFERYLSSSNNYIHGQPHVNELAMTTEMLRKKADKYPNLIKFLDDQASFLSGKAEPLDQVIRSSELLGPGVYKGLMVMNKNFVRSLVMLNPGIPVAQLIGLQSPIAQFGPVATTKGLAASMFNSKVRAFVIKNSLVVRERAYDSVSRYMGGNIVDKIGGAPIGFMDIEVVMADWVTRFSAGVKRGLGPKAAIRFAERGAAKFQGFTSKINTPKVLRSKLVQSAYPLMNQATAFASSMWFENIKPMMSAKAAQRMGVKRLSVANAKKLLYLVGSYAAYQKVSEAVLGRSSLGAFEYALGASFIARAAFGAVREIATPMASFGQAVNAATQGDAEKALKHAARFGIDVGQATSMLLYGNPLKISKPISAYLKSKFPLEKKEKK